MYKNSTYVISVFFTCNGHIFIKPNRCSEIRFNKLEFNRVKKHDFESGKYSTVKNHSNIKIDIPILLMFKLLLNNSLRQEINRMINYHISQFKFNIDYNGSVYPIDSYYCRISSGKLSDTRNMFFLL